MERLSLTTRAFLFSVLPVCLALAASFLALHAAVHQRIRKGLRESLQASNSLLNRASSDYRRRTIQPRITTGTLLFAKCAILLHFDAT